MVDKCKIIIDLVHSHASNNMNDGIDKFYGTDSSFLHAGKKGIIQIGIRCSLTILSMRAGRSKDTCSPIQFGWRGRG